MKDYLDYYRVYRLVKVSDPYRPYVKGENNGWWIRKINGECVLELLAEMESVEGILVQFPMIEAYYDYDFDILAFAEHGIHGKEWDQEPSIIPLYTFQNLWHGKRVHPTTEEYHAFLDGTYKTEKNERTKKRRTRIFRFRYT